MSTNPHNYKNLLEAVDGLRNRGFTFDFQYQDSCLHCDKISEKFAADDLMITEYYRFEGMSDPEDSSVIYALESKDGHKGIIIDAYGAYSDEHISAFLSNVKVKD
ncbi:hypothetical protein SAMN05421813_12450 [Daejeonella rubra]|uniref:Phosphoribosylpyrophosphate synthetase n=1 Tax=Daejeonella rubra TaxID=990371 RepID=A0A1G9WBF9_9SPHI|nr:phosphoribosylpyrophosphate synthetase [Daejeonella rubra]SDM81878.1 hypothetical protein SAMN05421813_12450 [Daejeonella rubra]